MKNNPMNVKIELAMKEIAEKSAAVAGTKYRQKYHFMAPTGWINDPNGLIYFKGKYHFFYQYYPYKPCWGPMHWGHAISDDMLHWEHLPVALAPSESYDDHFQGGCFSGSAIAHEGKLYLMYTGQANHGNGHEQTQCIAYSEDGIHFEKYAGNPVITAPEGIPTDCFRDPKVWKHGDWFYMVCGASRNQFSQALIYKSRNLFHWEFLNVLYESRGEWGYMFECPDFFPLEDKFVLVFSPMGSGERTSVYLVGDFDYETGRFFSNVSGEIDWGHDYYAPASFETPDHRRIMVAWANGWDWMPFFKDWGPTYEDGWSGHFNIPREVYLKEDLTLAFRPIRELELIHGEAKMQTEQTVSNPVALGQGFCYDCRIVINLKKTDAKEIVLKLRKSGDQVTKVTYDLKNGYAYFERNQSDHWSKGTAKAPLNLIGKNELELRILSDRSSVETFANEYQTNMSCNVYTTVENEENTIEAVGGIAAVKSIEFLNLAL